MNLEEETEAALNPSLARAVTKLARRSPLQAATARRPRWRRGPKRRFRTDAVAAGGPAERQPAVVMSHYGNDGESPGR